MGIVGFRYDEIFPSSYANMDCMTKEEIFTCTCRSQWRGKKAQQKTGHLHITRFFFPLSNWNEKSFSCFKSCLAINENTKSPAPLFLGEMLLFKQKDCMSSMLKKHFLILMVSNPLPLLLVLCVHYSSSEHVVNHTQLTNPAKITSFLIWQNTNPQILLHSHMVNSWNEVKQKTAR